MRVYAVLLAVVAACSFQRSGATTDAGDDGPGGGDGPPIDAPTDASDPGMVCIGTFVEVCRSMPATMVDLMLGNEVIDTDNDPRCVPQPGMGGGPEMCVIAGHNITVAPTTKVRAIGARPLVLAAFDNFKIEANGSLSVSSPKGQPAGAGANFACTTTDTAGEENLGFGGGGAGGSMRGKGGPGGTGNGGLAGRGVAQEPFPAMFTFVHGGCAGAPGGGNGGAGGASGGAVMIIAKKKIDMKANAFIVASGEGGSGPDPGAGGGGGGSGGFIGLDAGTELALDTNSHFAANGGGGGSGGGPPPVFPGNPGQDGTDGATGVGGGIEGTGGSGGAGSGGIVLLGDDGNDGLPTGGGGGGGGGAGAIILFNVGATTGPFSPQPTQQ